MMPGIRRGLLLLLLLASLTGSVPLACGPREVHFPDPEIEAYIRRVIEKPEGAIFPSDLTEITDIGFGESWDSGGPPSDLTGVEYCVNLRKLYIEGTGHKIRDLSPLTGLTNLTLLCLPYGEISDLSPLAHLTNLTDLVLYGNQISDISPLASLTNLTDLWLDGNQISDISPLATLTSLIELHLTYNQISDISSLASLNNLTTLYLAENQISDISPLTSLLSLKSLSLGHNPLSSASVNIYIPQLQERGARVSW